MCFSVCKKTGQGGWCATALFNVMLRQNQKQRWDCRLWKQWLLKTCFGFQETSCRWVALPHARKTELTRETCIIKNTHHVFRQLLNHLHQDKTFKKRYPVCLISITLRDSQNNYSSLLKSVEKHSQKCHVTRLYDKLMHI